ncbi:hypothetical protein [Peribacillus muralis]|uniref:hypothetical protein n=1 Tax=Peribacillus muralis TaxID=264697 RepID=UPI003D0936E8
MYNYNYAFHQNNVPYYYDNHHSNMPYQYAERVQSLVPTATIQSQLKAGRQGHCFRGYWGNSTHTFILMGINNTTGMVQILEDGLPNEVHHNDIVGLQYLGLQCPPVQQPGQQGGQQGQPFPGFPGGQQGGQKCIFYNGQWYCN